MKNKLLFLFLMCGFPFTLLGQERIADSLMLLFQKQLTLYPQEKIYIHTDKPYYISGEQIWFRAYLVDAVTHIPSPVSRYVYVELINPLDSVVARVKIQAQEEAYHGYLPIPAHATQGDYTLRAYTTFMRNQDENYFFTKTIPIGVVTTGTTQTAAQRASEAVPDDDFDLSFYPEGGDLLLGTPCKVAFKAMKSNGQATQVSGTIYNQDSVEIATFKSEHLGMGSFTFLAQKGERYVALCQNDLGQSKCFELPEAVNHGAALSVTQARGNLCLSVQKPAEAIQDDTLYLFAHTRGMVHLIELWDGQKNLEVISKDWFPSGVLQLVLFNTRLQPLSERLVFIHHDDQAQITYQLDKESYAKRSMVKNRVTVMDEEERPLVGNFSVAVTSDRAIVHDSGINILTYLLLTSDLHGYIEDPAYYFQNVPESEWALDLLMCTQGWRRYHTAAWAQGHFVEPEIPVELDAEIRGTVKNGSSGNPVEDVEVIATSFTGGYFQSAQTDLYGRFCLPIGGFPDSTLFMVSIGSKKSASRMELSLEQEHFAKRSLQTVPSAIKDRSPFTQYVHQVRERYIRLPDDRDDQVTHLDAAQVTAELKPMPKSSHYYTKPDVTISWEEIEKIQPKNIYDVLQRLSGVKVYPDGSIFIREPRRSSAPHIPLVLVNGVLMDMSEGVEWINGEPFKSTVLDAISIHDIAQIDILKDVTKTNMFGERGGKGVISIFLKDGRDVKKSATGEIASPSPHIKTMMPLGYQQQAEFYAPKYENEAQRNNPKPDLRTTIHWQPVVRTDSKGVALFEFFTDDEPTSYTVIIEGLANDGTIIRKEFSFCGL